MTYADDLAIEVRGLVKAYGEVRVLDHLDLTVERGSVYALLGPNGAGKTTTVRILATLTRPDAGTVRVVGHDVVRERAAVRRSISLTGQYAAVDDAQTGRENLAVIGRLAGLPAARARSRAAELLDRVDLAAAADRRVSTYSGGMRRKLDLAAGLLVPPRVMFLDEPTTGLDPHSRQQTWQLVTELAEAGTTVSLTTQYLEEADRLADRVAVLDGGRLVAEGSAAELKATVGEGRLVLIAATDAAFDAVLARLDRPGAEGIGRADRARREVETVTDGTAAHVRALLDAVDPERTDVASFAVHTATLDDVFLSLTRRSQDPALEVVR